MSNMYKFNKKCSILVTRTDNMLKININDNGNLEMYAPIKDVAKYLGYESGNGTYTVTSEDTNSCYVKNENEVAIFQVDSDVVTKIDLSNISLETDSPYLSPEPLRGKVNVPKNVIYVARKIAELKSVSLEEVLEVTSSNVINKFDLYVYL